MLDTVAFPNNRAERYWDSKAAVQIFPDVFLDQIRENVVQSNQSGSDCYRSTPRRRRRLPQPTIELFFCIDSVEWPVDESECKTNVVAIACR